MSKRKPGLWRAQTTQNETCVRDCNHTIPKGFWAIHYYWRGKKWICPDCVRRDPHLSQIEFGK